MFSPYNLLSRLVGKPFVFPGQVAAILIKFHLFWLMQPPYGEVMSWLVFL
jgi:hypothetical protein